MDTLFAVSTAAAGILSVLAVLLAIRPGFPGTGWLIGNSMVSEGATRQMRGDGGFAAYPVPLAGDVLQIAAGYALQAGTHGSALNQDMAQAVPDGPSAQDSQDTQTDTGKVMYLTFDDGPRRSTTTALLDGLAQRGVNATFFLIGEQLVNNEDVVQRMDAEGHQIGIHTFDHVKLTGLSKTDFDAQVDKTRQCLLRILGHNDFLLRPPYGMTDQGVKKHAGCPIILWSVDPEDWRDQNTARVVQQVVSQARDGSIILMHDIFPESVDAALQIVDQLHAQGYLFVTVDQLFAARHIPLDAGKTYSDAYP